MIIETIIVIMIVILIIVIKKLIKHIWNYILSTFFCRGRELVFSKNFLLKPVPKFQNIKHETLNMKPANKVLLIK